MEKLDETKNELHDVALDIEEIADDTIKIIKAGSRITHFVVELLNKYFSKK